MCCQSVLKKRVSKALTCWNTWKIVFSKFLYTVHIFEIYFGQNLSRRICMLDSQKKYPQTLVKPIFIKLGWQTRITTRNYQTSVSISIDTVCIIKCTWSMINPFSLPSLKLWNKTQYLAQVWKPRETRCCLFLLFWAYQARFLWN